ncbi:MAG: DUF4142 domain-containing protein [Burkholderiales bacterium]|nr:DUF4142 domain-containing protein [Bacteroidia bacterium]
MKKVIVFTLISLFSLAIKAQLSERDRKFVKCTAEEGLYEVKLGELARKTGLSIDVKALATHMVEDHSKANSELKELADKKGIAFPTSMNSKAMKHYDKLAKKQGKDFDKAYTMCLMMTLKKSICMFKKEVKKGSDTDIKAWAANTLKTLEQHKEMTKETCNAIKEKKKK